MLRPSTPIPTELRSVTIVRLEKRSAERLWQTRIIESDPQIVSWILADGTHRPSIANARAANEDPEAWCVVALAIVVRDKAQLRIDRQRMNAAGPAAILRGGECADDIHYLFSSASASTRNH